MSRVISRIHLAARLEAQLGGKMEVSEDSVLWKYPLPSGYSISVLASNEVYFSLRDDAMDLELMGFTLARERIIDGWAMNGDGWSGPHMDARKLADDLYIRITILAKQIITFDGIFRKEEDERNYLLAKMMHTEDVALFLVCYDRVARRAVPFVPALLGEIVRSRGGEIEQVIRNRQAAQELIR